MTSQPFPYYKPLFSLTRAGISEVVIYGYTLLLHGDELLAGSSEALESPLIPRSTLKPWQFIATNVADERKFWSLGIASHSCQSIHQIELENFITTMKLNPTLLKCPESMPKDPKAAAPFIVQKTPKKKVFHQCSGKHLMYLSACQKFHFDESSYTALQHPLNQALLKMMSDVIGRTPALAYDSCSLPNFILNAKEFLKLAHDLASRKNAFVDLMFHLWGENPRLVGGMSRLDSDITEELDGLFYAKEGADGLLMLIHRSAKPIICIVKLSSGYNQKFVAYALWRELKLINNLPEPLQKLRDYLSIKIRDYLEPDHQLALIC